MTSRDFCYWLQGYFELQCSGPVKPEPHSRYNLQDYQIEMIRNHLQMVFKHEIDPSHGDKMQQEFLKALDEGASKIDMTVKDGSWSTPKTNC